MWSLERAAANPVRFRTTRRRPADATRRRERADRRAAAPRSASVRLDPRCPDRERQIYLEIAWRRSLHQGEVALLHVPAREGGLERPRVLRIAPAGDQAARLAIETVRRIRLVSLRVAVPGRESVG